MQVGRRLIVRGRVQGVGFRYFTQRAAAYEGVSGWVQNLPDGGVEVYVAGEAASVARVERQVRSGPPRARVERVEVHDEEAPPTLKGFSIR